ACTFCPTGWLAIASIVVTCAAPTADTGVTQLRIGLPSRCTVQAPHWATPQPYFGPVIPRVSRRVQRSGVSGSTSASITLPLTLSLKAMARCSRCCRNFRAPVGGTARIERYIAELHNHWEFHAGAEARRLEFELHLAALRSQRLLQQPRAEAGAAVGSHARAAHLAPAEGRAARRGRALDRDPNASFVVGKRPVLHRIGRHFVQQ